MKNKLAYQITEYDCGPATIINAFCYLFEREELAPDLIRSIYLYCNDAYNDQGEFGKKGTSKAATCYLATWLNDYATRSQLPLDVEVVTDEAAEITPGSPTWEWIKGGGIAMICCWIEDVGHYVLMTGFEEGDKRAYLFDPYDEPDEEVVKVEGMTIVHDQPLKMNRIVPIERINRHEKLDYALGVLRHRRNLLFRRTDR